MTPNQRDPALPESQMNLQKASTGQEPSARVWRRAALFLLSKAALIMLTIFSGVFITVLLVSQSGQMEKAARTQVANELFSLRYTLPQPITPESEARLEAARLAAEERLGLNLSFWPRQIKWTWDALRLDWDWPITSHLLAYSPTGSSAITYQGLILRHFPRTILLAGVSNFLIFILGLPLALYLTRRYGTWLDRGLSLLVPISSVPSWVHGVLLISVLAVEFRLFPPSGMLDTIPPDSSWKYALAILRHLALPTLAIFLSLFFQLVSAWQTYFLIYSAEDYVELGQAKGLPNRILEQQYLLRPTLPYVITSFSLSLVTFWQALMPLEVVFDWPGIGWLFIKKAMPNFWGEAMYKGDLIIAVGVIVIFAYLLGAIVFLLDIVYLLVDPRIHLAEPTASLRVKAPKARPPWALGRPKTGETPLPLGGQTHQPGFHQTVSEWVEGVGDFTQTLTRGAKSSLIELKRYPQAVLGLVSIALLVLGSLYAVIALPYEKIGRTWSREVLTGRAEIPHLARPAWINWFRTEKLLSTLQVSTQEPQTPRQTELLENQMRQVSFDLAFDYPYAEPPREVFLYLEADYLEKRPFVTLNWLTPDGRQFNLRGVSVEKPFAYSFAENLPYKRLVAANQNWQKWFQLGQVFTTPPHTLLFVDPQAETPLTVKGTYHLQIKALFFEPQGEVRADLVLLGQVYGLAGTDYLRRDLLVPLLWGLPFALVFGLFGALVTTLISMLVAASGVWFGGWVDQLIQRLTEANLILPVLAMAVLAQALFNISLWVILAVVVLLNIFGSPTKNFRAAFLQMKSAPYLEAALVYNASHRRIIFSYLLPRLIPILIPQLITLIPSYVFLEATLGLFNIKSDYPTWGTVIYQALTKGALWGSTYWVLEPLALLLFTGLAFAMLGSALERSLNPRLQEND